MFALRSGRSKRYTSRRAGGYHSVAVRLATQRDEADIRRIASLDGREPPAGRVLVAEADGEVIAALGVGDGRATADPFRWTSDVMALLQMRAEQMAAAESVAAADPRGAVPGLRTQAT